MHRAHLPQIKQREHTFFDNTPFGGVARSYAYHTCVRDHTPRCIPSRSQAKCKANKLCVAFMYGGSSYDDNPFHKKGLCELADTVCPDANFGDSFRFCKENTSNTPECNVATSSSPSYVNRIATRSHPCVMSCRISLTTIA